MAIIICGELDTSVQTDHVLYAVFLPICMPRLVLCMRLWMLCYVLLCAKLND